MKSEHSAVFLLGGAAIALTWATTSLLKSKRQQEQRLPRQLLPRFFLLQSLLDKIDELGTSFKDDWSALYNELNDVLKNTLDAVKKGVPSEPGSVVSERSVEQVVRVIDEELLTLIQSKPALVESLRDDVPIIHQTWADFVDLKLAGNEELQRIFEAEIRRDGDYQTELLKNCLKLVKQLISQLDCLNKSLFGGATRSSSAVISGSPAPVNAYDVMKILYATDRQFTVDGDYNGMPRESGTSDPQLQYGTMEVAIPKAHVKGKLEAPLGAEEADPCKHFVILSTDTKPRSNKSQFLDIVNDHVRETRRNTKKLHQSSAGSGAINNSAEILIYVHGFRSSLKKAIKRAAQLKKDLEFEGTVILYSWSSQGTPWGYFQDEKNVRKTVWPLQDFISTIARQVKEEDKVHLMAHSMGNRALVRALLKLYQNPAEDSPLTRLSQVVFAAADERIENFLELVTVLEKLMKWNSALASGLSPSALRLPTLTVYCSTDDTALQASRSLHLQLTPRLGDLRSYLRAADKVESLHEFVDVVDATGVGESNFQHSYFCDVGSVLADLKAVLQCRRASARIGSSFHRVSDREPKTYYSFQKKKSYSMNL